MIPTGGTGSRPCVLSSVRHPNTQPTEPSPPATYKADYHSSKRVLSALSLSSILLSSIVNQLFSQFIIKKKE
jgi:hypothetical protein